MSEQRVVLTSAATRVIRRVKERRKGAPFLFADYMAGPTERLVGEADGVRSPARQLLV